MKPEFPNLAPWKFLSCCFSPWAFHHRRALLLGRTRRGVGLHRDIIDTLKKNVPIWKKETFSDGVMWKEEQQAAIHQPDLSRDTGTTATLWDGE